MTLSEARKLATTVLAAFPLIAGQPIDPKIYQGYVEEGFLPLRDEMTDLELAVKLDLDLPRADGKALEKALADYLTGKIPPLTVTPTGKLTPEAKAAADRWLADKLEYHGFTYQLGANMNFWNSVAPDALDANSDVGFAGWRWLGPLCVAYQATGDAKYAEAMLMYARAFYHNARPPAKRLSWTQRYFRGPWYDNWVSTRLHLGVLWKAYQYFGNYPDMTDADRVMFLKMIWEHADWCYNLMSVHRNDTFESAHVGRAFLNVPLTLPEFKDTKLWLDRLRQRYTENVRDSMLDDGGSAIQRTGYNFGASVPCMEVYRLFKQHNVPIDPEFRRGLERVCDFSMYVLSPTQEYAMFGSGSLGPLESVVQNGAELYPERADFAYVASGGKTGTPPARTVKVLWHEGWLSMRSDWSTNALFMVLNYNGSPKETQQYVTGANLNSFALWANGWPYVTDSGATAGYGEKEFWDWCMHTRACNTVLVDDDKQDHVTNGGRVESWACLPDGSPPPHVGGYERGLLSSPRREEGADERRGFTYLAAVSTAYRKFGVTHRRAVFFVRPNYWLLYDVLTGDGKPHKYNWQGHFQPATMQCDPMRKVTCVTPARGKPLWVVPARPESFVLEQKSGPIVTREGNEPPPRAATRQIAPYISLEKSNAVEPFAFSVLLYPTTTEESAPTMESLVVMEKGVAVPDARAIGLRVRAGNRDDLLALSSADFQSAVSPISNRQSAASGLETRDTAGWKPALRRYGDLMTDGEAAYVRHVDGKLTEAGMASGRTLQYQRQKLITAGPDITSVHVRFDGGLPVVTAQGRGRITVWPGGRISVGTSGSLKLTAPQFSTAPKTIGKAVGIPVVIPDPAKDDVDDPAMYIAALSYPDMVVVTWQTAQPANATIEYGGIRTTNPEPLTEHRFLLSQLENGVTYQLRILCQSEEGRIGKLETKYTHTTR